MEHEANDEADAVVPFVGVDYGRGRVDGYAFEASAVETEGGKQDVILPVVEGWRFDTDPFPGSGV